MEDCQETPEGISRLLQRANKKDRVAAEALVKIFMPLTVTVLKQRFPLMSRNDCLSCFHDTIMTFIECPSKYDPTIGRFEPLLLTSACNLIKDIIRRIKRQQIFEQLSDNATLDRHSSPVTPFHDRLESKEDWEEFCTKINGLRERVPPVDRALIDRFMNNEIFEKKWAKEMAPRFEISPNTLVKRWSRLKVQIKRCMEA